MNSMTGFGYAEGEGSGVHMSTEIKALNTRYLDMIVSLPPSLSTLESRIREQLQSSFIRGRLEVTVRVRDVEESVSVTVDKAVAGEWQSALEDLAGILGGTQEVTLDMIVKQDGVLKVERKRDSEGYWDLLSGLLKDAIDQVAEDRLREGVDLGKDIENQLNEIEKSLERVAVEAPVMKKEVEENLRIRFSEILGDDIGEQRVLMEIAAWIAKTDINEEMVRLAAHIQAFRDEMSRTGAKGKKLDFLAQEIGREVNTIGSKSPRAQISREVVDMKDALEKVREQLRNVE
ncbi:MAG: YicC family protein [Spirochaetaceae bacterium]|nr:YicC family protein [Spirochaetaceae bacterium]